MHWAPRTPQNPPPLQATRGHAEAPLLAQLRGFATPSRGSGPRMVQPQHERSLARGHCSRAGTRAQSGHRNGPSTHEA